MKWNLISSQTLKTGPAVIGLLIAGVATTGLARAGCGDGAQPSTHHSSVRRTLAVYTPGESAFTAFTPVGDEWTENSSIVGLWEFEVRASMDEGPFRKGDLIDWGLATWHDDGTEIQFSAGRPYDAGDVCMGVWKQTGRGKFHLNHIALGKDLATGATFDGLTNIRADVTVDRSDMNFTGTYQIIQYSGSPTDGTEFDQTTVRYQFLGTVAAKRVTAD